MTPSRVRSMADTVHSLSISGMTCGGCSSRLQRVLESTPGVLKAKISHDSGAGLVTTGSEVSSDFLIKVINSAGFEASG